jgi:Uri superfamily endonuclease
VKVGRLGELKFSGLYGYTGSAMGKGSTNLRNRISRHLRSEQKKIRWHIDYLLDRPDVEVKRVVTSATLEKRKECEVAMLLNESAEVLHRIDWFGSSDCSCSSHLAYLGTNLNRSVRTITEAHLKAGLKPLDRSKYP